MDRRAIDQQSPQECPHNPISTAWGWRRIGIAPAVCCGVLLWVAMMTAGRWPAAKESGTKRPFTPATGASHRHLEQTTPGCEFIQQGQPLDKEANGARVVLCQYCEPVVSGVECGPTGHVVNRDGTSGGPSLGKSSHMASTWVPTEPSM